MHAVVTHAELEATIISTRHGMPVTLALFARVCMGTVPGFPGPVPVKGLTELAVDSHGMMLTIACFYTFHVVTIFSVTVTITTSVYTDVADCVVILKWIIIQLYRNKKSKNLGIKGLEF